MTDKYRNTPKGRIAPNGYRLCDPLSEGEELTDNKNNTWVIEKPIGCGGFGEIYLCHEKNDPKKTFVMKLDNLNGPLFVEVHFVIRVWREEKVKQFISSRKIDFLGFPKFIGWGTDNTKKNGYRFLIMERLGEEFQKVLEKIRLSIRVTCRIACRIIDVLEYIHEQGYIHADIKAQNILRAAIPKNESSASNKKRTSNKRQVFDNDDDDNIREDDKYYLIDYGLVELYKFQGAHKSAECDKRKANNGTCEFRSRDAHIGVISRRSDIESLGYNIILWFYGRHPWENMLKNADSVHQKKVWAMNNIDDFLKEAFSNEPLINGNATPSDSKGKSKAAATTSKKSVPTWRLTSPPKGLNKFFQEIKALSHDAKPNYEKLKKILSEISDLNETSSTSFSQSTKATSNGGSGKKKKQVGSSNGSNVSSTKRTINRNNKRNSEQLLDDDAIDAALQSTNQNKRALSSKVPLRSKSNHLFTNGSVNGTKTSSFDDDETEEEDEELVVVLPTKRNAALNGATRSNAKRQPSSSQKKVKQTRSNKSSENVSVSNRALRTRSRMEDINDLSVSGTSSPLITKKEMTVNGKNRRLPRLSTPLMLMTPPEGNSPLFGPFVTDDSVKENQNLPNRSICSNISLSYDTGDDDEDDDDDDDVKPQNHHLRKTRIYINNQRCDPHHTSQTEASVRGKAPSNVKKACSDLSMTEDEEEEAEEETASFAKSIGNGKLRKQRKSLNLSLKIKKNKANGLRKLNGHISPALAIKRLAKSTSRSNRTTKKATALSNVSVEQSTSKPNISSSSLSPTKPVVETAAMQRIRMLIQKKKLSSTPRK